MPTTIHPQHAFPLSTPDSVLAFQFSSWYPRFKQISIKSTVIKPLEDSFQEYLNSDGVFVPDGSENGPSLSTFSDDEDEMGDSSSQPDSEYGTARFTFPELDDRIRQAISEYEAVFPKLNFSSPRDAAWVLPMSYPLRCTSPADVYLLLKSSDFVSHDLDPGKIFQHCEGRPQTYELELVLRKWYPVDRAREFRCFVRQETLLGITQRDPNYYPFLNEQGMERRIVEAISRVWEENVKGKWEVTRGDYTLDVLLTRDLKRCHVIDFNPYAPSTDPLLFTYDELLALLEDNSSGDSSRILPAFKVIDSPAHPAAASNAPIHQHNMVPFEALSLSSGRDIEEFAKVWKDEIRASTKG